jgi:hypothetical protein
MQSINLFIMPVRTVTAYLSYSGKILKYPAIFMVTAVDLRSYQVGAELPVDSEEAEKEKKSEKGTTLLYVFERGYLLPSTFH